MMLDIRGPVILMDMGIRADQVAMDMVREVVMLTGMDIRLEAAGDEQLKNGE